MWGLFADHPRQYHWYFIFMSLSFLSGLIGRVREDHQKREQHS
jgi:hypothetical protein